MQRSKYFNNTKPTQVQLNHTEDSRSNSILRRQRATAQMGIVRGFQVTVNSADNTKIDIGPGEGYTGGHFKSLDIAGENSAERISTITDTATGLSSLDNTATSVNLASYTANIDNYVTLVYVETEESPLTDIFYPYATHNTVVRESFRVEVLTKTQWDALTVEEKRLRILTAIVTANGAGTALTASSIDQVVQPKSHPTPTQPVTITGITITGTSDETPVGTGTLRWEVSTGKLYWTAPTDSEGTGISISITGSYVIYSNNDDYNLTLSVITTSLPAVDTSEDITISSLYGQTIPKYSAEDTVHRDMVGSGQPSSYNPHGITITDIGGGTLDHQDLFHVNGISIDANGSQLFSSIYAVGTIDRIDILNLGGEQNSFNISGNTYQNVAGYAAGDVVSVNFSGAGAPGTGVYMLYLDASAEVQRLLIGEDLWDSNIIIVDMRNSEAGATANIAWDATARTLTYTAAGDVAGTPVQVADNTIGGTDVEGYYKLYSDNGDWIIVYCDGNLGGTNNTTFTTDMNTVDNPEDEVLRLCSVNWNIGTETLSDLEDLRHFRTADTRDELYEEHDKDGYHTKVIRNQLRVAVDSTAAMIFAENNVGLFASASQQGLFGSASARGIQADAINTALYATASTAAAGLFYAPNIGVSASVKTARAVVGVADDSFAGSFFAASETGIRAIAGENTAIHAIATSAVGVYAEARDGNYAVVAHASSSAGYFHATGVEAIKVWAEGDIGGSFQAANTAVYASATESYGGSFIAADGVGLEASASVYGGRFYADSTGLLVSASAEKAIVAYCAGGDATGAILGTVNCSNLAVNPYGVAGWGSNSIDGQIATGVYGYAINSLAGHQDSCVGVKGLVGGSGGTGVVGTCAVDGTGVMGLADGYGVYGEGGTIGVLGTGPIGVSGSGSVGVAGTGSTAVDATGVNLGASIYAPDTGAYIRNSNSVSWALYAENIDVANGGGGGGILASANNAGNVAYALYAENTHTVGVTRGTAFAAMGAGCAMYGIVDNSEGNILQLVADAYPKSANGGAMMSFFNSSALFFNYNGDTVAAPAVGAAGGIRIVVVGATQTLAYY